MDYGRFLLLILLVMVLAACGRDSNVTPTPEPTEIGIPPLESLPDVTITRENVADLTQLGILSLQGTRLDVSAVSPIAALQMGNSAEAQVQLIDISTGEPQDVATFEAPLGRDIAFSPDGSRFAIITDEVRVFDIESNTLLFQVATRSASLNGTAFSPDGTQIAAAFFGGATSQARIWDIESGELVRDFPGGNSAGAVTFSPDGSQLAYDNSDRDRIIVADIATGEIERELFAPISRLNELRFSPDGSMLVAASRNADIFVWNTETGALLYEFTDFYTLGADFVRFSPDSTLLATASTGDDEWYIFDMSTGEVAFSAPVDINSVDWLPDGTGLITTGDDITVVWGVTPR